MRPEIKQWWTMQDEKQRQKILEGIDFVRAIEAEYWRQHGTCRDCNRDMLRGLLNGYDRCGDCQTKDEARRNFTKDFTLAVNDRIRVTHRGATYTGKVLTAYFYGQRDGWYIEFRKTNGDYAYWKQGMDGGTVEKLPEPPSAAEPPTDGRRRRDGAMLPPSVQKGGRGKRVA